MITSVFQTAIAALARRIAPAAGSVSDGSSVARSLIPTMIAVKGDTTSFIHFDEHITEKFDSTNSDDEEPNLLRLGRVRWN